MKLVFWKAALALGAFALGSPMASADPVKLTFGTLSPAGTPNAAHFQKWVDKVNEMGEGVVEVELRDGTTIANFVNVYDRVQDGILDIGWMIPALYGDKFPLSPVVSLPFLTDDNVACSVAMWRLYEEGYFAEEMKDIQPIDFSCSDMTFMHFAEAPDSIDTLDGLKVRVKSKPEGAFVEALGGTSVSMPSGEQYQALQRGTVDAIDTGWAGFPAYSLNEVANYHVEAPLGMALIMHFMSKKKFDSLPQEVQDILLTAGGETYSREMGEYMNVVAKTARDEAIELNHEIVELSPEQLETWKAAAAPIAEEWAKEHGEQGAKLLNAFKEAVAAAETSN
jgi:TRAP-type C4-dicarboxylate transport system substrate-binding protein